MQKVGIFVFWYFRFALVMNYKFSGGMCSKSPRALKAKSAPLVLAMGRSRSARAVAVRAALGKAAKHTMQEATKIRDGLPSLRDAV